MTNEQTYKSFFQPTGFDVSVVGIGDEGRKAVFDPQLLHNVRMKNSLIDNLFLFDDSDFQETLKRNFDKSGYIIKELQASDMMFSLGNMSDDTNVEIACTIAEQFDSEKSDRKHSVCVYYGEINQVTVFKLNKHYDTVIRIEDEKLLSSPFFFLCVTMLQVGFVGIDYVYTLFALRKMTVGYFDDFLIDTDNKQNAINALSTRIKAKGLTDETELVADVWLTVSENIYLAIIDDTTKMLSNLIQKDLTWSASFEPNFEEDIIQITIVYGVDNGVKDWIKSDGWYYDENGEIHFNRTQKHR